MVALIEYPGSSNFQYKIGTKKQCLAWLKSQEESTEYNRVIIRTHRVISNKEAAKMRWRNGFKVINFSNASNHL